MDNLWYGGVASATMGDRREEIGVTVGVGEERAAGAGAVTADVFLSYASQDAAVAEVVVAALEQQGIKCWIAPRDVTPGAFYAGAIVQAIDAARATVLILSQSSAASPHVVREVERAASKRHPVLSLRIDQVLLPPDLEYFLNSSQWLEADGDNLARVIPRLAAALRLTLDRPAILAGPATTALKSSAGRRNLRHLSVVAGSVMLIALGAFAIFEYRQRARLAAPSGAPIETAITPAVAPAAPPAAERSVAVLPFVDMSEKKDQEYFADGLSEELIDKLAHFPQLRVTARTSSFQFKGKSEDVRTIGTQLGVATLLEGSVRKAGRQMRITAQLVRTSDGAHLWSESYDRMDKEIFKVQADIASAVVRALNVVLIHAESVDDAPPKSIEAYHLLLKGDYIYERQDKGDLALAIETYQRALALDPRYALALARLSRAYLWAGIWGEVPIQEASVKARHAAEQALAINPRLAAAHRWLGRVRMNYDFDWTGAQQAFEEAIRIDGAGAEGENAREDLLVMTGARTGKFDELIELDRARLARNPLDPHELAFFAWIQSMAGRHRESADAYRRLLELKPEYRGARGSYGRELLFDGKATEAVAMAKTESDDEGRVATLACIYAMLGQKKEADAALADLLHRFSASDEMDIAVAYACSGNADEAERWLDRMYEKREPFLMLIKVDPILSRLRGHAGYEALVKKLGLNL
jgi:TolB-like protein